MKHENPERTLDMVMFDEACKMQSETRPELPHVPGYSNSHWRKASLGSYVGKMIQVRDYGAYFWGRNKENQLTLQFLPPDAITLIE